jgi:hypothetical protein
MRTAFFSIAPGHLNAANWATEVVSLRANLRWSPNRAAWRLTRDTYGPDFQAYVDSVLESTKNEIVGGDFDVVDAWKAALAEDRQAPATLADGKA